MTTMTDVRAAEQAAFNDDRCHRAFASVAVVGDPNAHILRSGGNWCSHCTHGGYTYEVYTDGVLELVTPAPRVEAHGNNFHVGCANGPSEVRAVGATTVVEVYRSADADNYHLTYATQIIVSPGADLRLAVAALTGKLVSVSPHHEEMFAALEENAARMRGQAAGSTKRLRDERNAAWEAALQEGSTRKAAFQEDARRSVCRRESAWERASMRLEREWYRGSDSEREALRKELPERNARLRREAEDIEAYAKSMGMGLYALSPVRVYLELSRSQDEYERCHAAEMVA